MRTGELSVAALCLHGLKVHPLCLSLDTHLMCLSPWSSVFFSMSSLLLVAQFTAPWLEQSKEHPRISFKFLGTHLVGAASFFLAEMCVCAQVQGGTCGLSVTIRTYLCEQLEGQVSVKWAMAGKNFQYYLLIPSCLRFLLTEDA